MPRFAFLFVYTLLVLPVSAQSSRPVDDLFALATARKGDLRLSVYITAQAVEQLLSTGAGRREAVSILRANGITRVFLEAYRSEVVPPELLRDVANYFRENGFDVAGGIATVPGKDFGVRQEARFSWFNFQNEKTQNDLKKVMEDSAPIFDSFIVDDFLCTADTSAESRTAKGSRSWGEYRRDLLSGLSKTVFIDPARKINPKMHMIIKYPQWYDRYHLFGYDVVREPQLYDEVWVGTESRGQNTKSFGFVQSYESFVVYRWLASLSGKKIGGAWFDHIDCDANDFIDQAYQSVIAGARELILFNYFNFTEGHPGQHLLRMEFEHLADLAHQVASRPVHGVAGYKPPHSDAHGNLYILDYIGMMGVPLVPVAAYPENAPVIFLPAQAAADKSVYSKVTASLKRGARVIVTTGFIAALPEGQALATRAGLTGRVSAENISADEIIVHGENQKLEHALKLDAAIVGGKSTVLLEALAGGKRIPFLTQNSEGNLFVLNAHTFSAADFDSLNEVLLSPAPVGMLDLPAVWANDLRKIFTEKLSLAVDAPTRVAVQPFGDDEMMIQNYNQVDVEVKIKTGERKKINAFNGNQIPVDSGTMTLTIPARSRFWIR